MPRFGDIPTGGGQPPTGVYIARVRSLEKGYTKAPGNKLVWSGEFEVEEPVTEAGSVAYEMFVVGNDDDPNGTDQETWNKSVGARRFRGLLKAANIAIDDDSEAEEAFDEGAAAVTDQKVCISVEQETEPETDRNGMPNQYAGKKRSRINRFYPLGTVAPMVAGQSTNGPKAPGAASRPASRPAATPGTAAAAAKQVVAHAPQPAKAPAGRVAAPAGRTPPPPAGGAKKPASGGNIALACGHTVPRAEVGSHADSCEILNAQE